MSVDPTQDPTQGPTHGPTRGPTQGVSGPLELKFDAPAGHRPGATWQHLIDDLWTEADGTSEALAAPLVAAEARRLLLTMLLGPQPHNYSDQIANGGSPAAPFYVRRAEEFIAANIERPITMDDVVAAAGSSARSIYAGFRRFRGTTPMAYLKQLRLLRAHHELLAADPTRQTVTEIAMKWRFFHLGYFAAGYRRRFGEPPSATLRLRGLG